jgi:formiminotetrahydrofolate cyclodeaminase
MVIFAFADPTVFGLVAAICSIIGTSLATLSHISGRKKAAEDAAVECHERLLAEQRRSEELSKKLQEIRLRYGEADDE